MDVVWLAEIKWDYLRTRKQQLIRRRPEDVHVLFLEPYARGMPNRFSFYEDDGVLVATVPFVKVIPSGPVRRLVDLSVVRRMIDANAARHVRRHMRGAGMSPRPTVVISNPFAIAIARNLVRSTLVYDCNDAHGAFPGVPAWLPALFEDTCRTSDAVVVSSSVLRETVAGIRGGDEGVYEVGNGVEFELFDALRRQNRIQNRDRVTVGYLGAVAPWYDFDALEHVARSRPQWRVLVVGPVLQGVGDRLARIASLPNVEVRGRVAHDEVPRVLSEFTVGVIPFLKTELTRGVNPNKMYEYLAMGIPVATTPFSPEVGKFPQYVSSGDGCEGFLGACDDAVSRALSDGAEAFSEGAVRLAGEHDWAIMADRFWSTIRSLGGGM